MGRAHLEWGVAGAKKAAGRGDVVVVVDVLRFSSAVATAVACGAMVYPYRGRNAASFARQVGADLAGGSSRYSLSPLSYRGCPRGARVVLPSPNGSTVTWYAARSCPVIAGSLLNAGASAAAAGELAARRNSGLTVVACGERPLERWQDERSYEVRPAIEDLLGAGSILAALTPALDRSAEAELAARAFAAAADDLAGMIEGSESGRELIDKGQRMSPSAAGRTRLKSLRSSRTAPS